MYVITNMYGCEKGHLVQAKRMKKWSMTLFRSLLSATVPISMNVKKKKKVKAAPLQAWSGPEGSRNLRFPDFMTVAQDGGKGVSLTHRTPLPPGNAPGTHFCFHECVCEKYRQKVDGLKFRTDFY